MKEIGLDFSKVKSAAVSLLTTKKFVDTRHQHGAVLPLNCIFCRAAMLNIGTNNALLEFLLEGTMPEVREYCRDSRKEVDKQLKAVCEAFIAASVDRVAGPIQHFMKRVEEHRRVDKTLNISREPWGRPDELRARVSEATRELKRHFPAAQRAMQLYLANRETEFILFRPIRVGISNTNHSLDHF